MLQEGAEEPIPTGPSATRKDIQLGRRLVHMANGVIIATAYNLFFTHTQVVHLFGAIACLVYILDRVRIHYPELIRRIPQVNDLLFRAEEQVRESAMVPYAVAILLTLITFPKPLALIAIYTLAIADPLSAVAGITYGKRQIVPDKTVEGSLAFFVAAGLIAAAILYPLADDAPGKMVVAAILIGLAAAVFEMLPLRIDDNLTIPLFVAFFGWIVCALFGIPLS